MPTTIQLPGGFHAVLKDKDELTNKEVKRIQKSQYAAAGAVLRLETDYGFDPEDKATWKQAAHMTGDEVDVLDLYQRACVKVRLVSWTCVATEADGSTVPRPLPADEEAVDDLPLPLYEAIVTAATEGINLLGGGDKDEDDPTDPKVSADDSAVSA
jgi:hypothetical protein